MRRPARLTYYPYPAACLSTGRMSYRSRSLAWRRFAQSSTRCRSRKAHSSSAGEGVPWRLRFQSLSAICRKRTPGYRQIAGLSLALHGKEARKPTW
jgi:hypothetical protein